MENVAQEAVKKSTKTKEKENGKSSK